MYKILVVEDEFEMRSNIKRYLEFNDFIVFDAANGEEGVNSAIENLPDLIISDISMPVLDGFEMLTILQKNIKTATIPFLFLSARSDKTDFREGMKLGANDFLSKPFSFSELIDIINIQLKKKELEKRQSEDRIEKLRESIRMALPHELRTPLNAILGFSSLLLNSNEISNDNKDMLQMIYASAQRLNVVLEKYIRYANLELISSNLNEVKNLQAKFTSSVSYIISEIAYNIADKYNRREDLIINICNDDLKISEEHLLLLIEELFDNAFKFSVEGQIVDINSYENNEIFHLIIKDNGQGFPKDFMSQIGAFVQFERKKYEQQGTGLGLIIAKKIMSIYNGNIDITSDEKSYTTVTASLPIYKELK